MSVKYSVHSLILTYPPPISNHIICIDIGRDGDSLREGDSLRDGGGWEDIFRNGSVVVLLGQANQSYNLFRIDIKY